MKEIITSTSKQLEHILRILKDQAFTLMKSIDQSRKEQIENIRIQALLEEELRNVE